jgi:hypothetical protein
MDHQEVGWEGIDLAHDRGQVEAVVNAVMNLRYCGDFLD